MTNSEEKISVKVLLKEGKEVFVLATKEQIKSAVEDFKEYRKGRLEIGGAVFMMSEVKAIIPQGSKVASSKEGEGIFDE